MAGTKRKSTVDEAFERLFGYEWGTTFSIPTEEKKANAHARTLLRIFGASRAARIWATTSDSAKRAKVVSCRAPTAQRTSTIPLAVLTPATGGLSARGRQLDYQSIELPPSLRDPSEGTAEGSSTQSAAGPSTAIPAAAKGSSIDVVLARLAEPKRVSTVQKTSDDWESFKDTDKQLQDELEKKAQGKDAYLVKQDFLQRVDHRRFEIEKEERERERSKRGAPS